VYELSPHLLKKESQNAKGGVLINLGYDHSPLGSWFCFVLRADVLLQCYWDLSLIFQAKLGRQSLDFLYFSRLKNYSNRFTRSPSHRHYTATGVNWKSEHWQTGWD